MKNSLKTVSLLRHPESEKRKIISENKIWVLRVHKGVDGKTEVPHWGDSPRWRGEDAPFHVMIRITIGQFNVYPLWLYFS